VATFASVSTTPNTMSRSRRSSTRAAIEQLYLLQYAKCCNSVPSLITPLINCPAYALAVIVSYSPVVPDLQTPGTVCMTV
jgi:hypothetical protein